VACCRAGQLKGCGKLVWPLKFLFEVFIVLLLGGCIVDGMLQVLVDDFVAYNKVRVSMVGKWVG